MNADPQPGLCGSKYFIFESGSRNLPQFGAGSERFSRLHYQLLKKPALQNLVRKKQ